MIHPPPEVKRILAHVGLDTEALTKPGESIWRVTGLPEEMSPSDRDDAGLRVGVDGGDQDPGEPYRDELRFGDWAGWLGDLTVCWVAESMARRAKRLELT